MNKVDRFLGKPISTEYNNFLMDNKMKLSSKLGKEQ